MSDRLMLEQMDSAFQSVDMTKLKESDLGSFRINEEKLLLDDKMFQTNRKVISV
jgi:hypothetical protein